MRCSVSIKEFRKRPLSSLESCRGSPLAVTCDEQVVFYCVPADLFSQFAEKARVASLESRAWHRRNSFRKPESDAGEDDWFFTDAGLQSISLPIYFHSHAYEEWHLLPVEVRREAMDKLGATEKIEGCEQFSVLSLPERSVRMVCEWHSEAIVVWAVSDCFPKG